jgi:putative phosphoribosyl transferase
MSYFADRTAAGRVLAGRLEQFGDDADAIVLGLARGGVPVAFEVARVLGLPLDVFLVRKLGVPGHEELAMGAIASGDVVVMNERVTGGLGLSEDVIEKVAARERTELKRREHAYRDGRPPADVRGLTAILIDDGLATGASMRAAIQALRELDAGTIVVAVPIAPPDTCEELEAHADAVVCAHTPEPFVAVGAWYESFEQTTDDEVRDVLARARAIRSRSGRCPAARR